MFQSCDIHRGVPPSEERGMMLGFGMSLEGLYQEGKTMRTTEKTQRHEKTRCLLGVLPDLAYLLREEMLGACWRMKMG